MVLHPHSLDQAPNEPNDPNNNRESTDEDQWAPYRQGAAGMVNEAMPADVAQEVRTADTNTNNWPETVNPANQTTAYDINDTAESVAPATAASPVTPEKTPDTATPDTLQHKKLDRRTALFALLGIGVASVIGVGVYEAGKSSGDKKPAAGAQPRNGAGNTLVPSPSETYPPLQPQGDYQPISNALVLGNQFQQWGNKGTAVNIQDSAVNIPWMIEPDNGTQTMLFAGGHPFSAQEEGMSALTAIDALISMRSSDPGYGDVLYETVDDLKQDDFTKRFTDIRNALLQYYGLPPGADAILQLYADAGDTPVFKRWVTSTNEADPIEVRMVSGKISWRLTQVRPWQDPLSAIIEERAGTISALTYAYKPSDTSLGNDKIYRDVYRGKMTGLNLQFVDNNGVNVTP